jgi:hypothetical protein
MRPQVSSAAQFASGSLSRDRKWWWIISAVSLLLPQATAAASPVRKIRLECATASNVPSAFVRLRLFAGPLLLVRAAKSHLD